MHIACSEPNVLEMQQGQHVGAHVHAPTHVQRRSRAISACMEAEAHYLCFFLRQVDEEGTKPHLLNPFAVSANSSRTQHPHIQQQQQPPAAPDITARYPKQQQHQQQQVSRQKQPKQRSLLRRIVRGLVLTGVSTGLVAAGAWAGTVAYR